MHVYQGGYSKGQKGGFYEPISMKYINYINTDQERQLYQIEMEPKLSNLIPFFNFQSFSELSVAKRLQEGGFRLIVGRAGLVTNSGYFPHMSMIVKVKLYLLSHRAAPIHPN